MQHVGIGAGSPSHAHFTQFPPEEVQDPLPGQEHCRGVPPQSTDAEQAAKTVVVDSNSANERAALADPNVAKIQLVCLLILIEPSFSGIHRWKINEHVRKQRLVRNSELARQATQYYYSQGKVNPAIWRVNPKLKCPAQVEYQSHRDVLWLTSSSGHLLIVSYSERHRVVRVISAREVTAR
jgi:hypothetical protein